MDMSTSTQLQAHTHGMSSSTEERALVLLGQGYDTKIVASACGVSESRISQLLSDDIFKARVTELRFEHIQKFNKQDSEYDEMESLLTEKFKQSIPLMMRPMELLKGLQVINAQKRRGSSAPDSVLATQQVVNITLPSVIINNFTSTKVETNIHNQVTKVGDLDLTTMQSGTLLNSHKSDAEAKLKVLTHEHSSTEVIPAPSPTVKPSNRYEDI